MANLAEISGVENRISRSGSGIPIRKCGNFCDILDPGVEKIDAEWNKCASSLSILDDWGEEWHDNLHNNGWHFSLAIFGRLELVTDANE